MLLFTLFHPLKKGDVQWLEILIYVSVGIIENHLAM